MATAKKAATKKTVAKAPVKKAAVKPTPVKKAAVKPTPVKKAVAKAPVKTSVKKWAMRTAAKPEATPFPAKAAVKRTRTRKHKERANTERRAPRSGAERLLNAAVGHITQRISEYDQPGGERSAAATVTAFNAITKRDLTEAEGWLFMQLLKDVRQFSNAKFHQDSAEDCIAFAALKGEALAACK